MTWVQIGWKVGPYVVILALLGYVGWLKYGISQRDLAEAKAVAAYQSRVNTLAGDLIIEQAIAMGVTAAKAGDAKERIRNVSLPPNELACEPICAASERQRLGTRGVRSTIFGSPAPGP